MKGPRDIPGPFCYQLEVATDVAVDSATSDFPIGDVGWFSCVCSKWKGVSASPSM